MTRGRYVVRNLYVFRRLVHGRTSVADHTNHTHQSSEYAGRGSAGVGTLGTYMFQCAGSPYLRRLVRGTRPPLLGPNGSTTVALGHSSVPRITSSLRLHNVRLPTSYPFYRSGNDRNFYLQPRHSGPYVHRNSSTSLPKRDTRRSSLHQDGCGTKIGRLWVTPEVGRS